jgi:DNA-binding SARP family transcriptional activator
MFAGGGGGRVTVDLRLVLMGGLTLFVGGEATTGATTRRRRLALLALLAMARERGMNRDKIQAYLWPESDSEHARHGLNQLLYFQRHHLDDGDLFLGRKTLRLNPDMISCDVWELEDALAGGAHETVVSLYQGSFLDGFYLRGTQSFERWVDGQRGRLEKCCAEAIWTLACRAAKQGDMRRAASWWRRALELNPFDADAVIRLVDAAVASGDRAGALQHARRHVELLQSELGLAPDPRVMAALERLLAQGA